MSTQNYVQTREHSLERRPPPRIAKFYSRSTRIAVANWKALVRVVEWRVHISAK